MKKNETFAQIMDQLARRHGVHTVFSDFLQMVICAFSLGAMEEQYLNIVRRYQKPEAYRLSEALGALVIEMTGDGNGMVDVLGAYFENNISHGHNGQFFTPQLVCDMIARMMNPIRHLERVLDPACGSGRLLMGYAKVNRFARFYGADSDANCARMTLINLYLNTLYGEVAWMNSLSNQYYGGWVIEPTIRGIHRIRQISEDESYIHLKLPATKQTTEKRTIVPTRGDERSGGGLPEIEIPVTEIETSKPTQGLLFEF